MDPEKYGHLGPETADEVTGEKRGKGKHQKKGEATYADDLDDGFDLDISSGASGTFTSPPLRLMVFLCLLLRLIAILWGSLSSSVFENA